MTLHNAKWVFISTLSMFCWNRKLPTWQRKGKDGGREDGGCIYVRKFPQRSHGHIYHPNATLVRSSSSSSSRGRRQKAAAAAVEGRRGSSNIMQKRQQHAGSFVPATYRDHCSAPLSAQTPSHHSPPHSTSHYPNAVADHSTCATGSPAPQSTPRTPQRGFREGRLYQGGRVRST